MKRIFVLICCVASVQSYAQGIKLENGKKITTTVSSVMNMDMGPMAGGEMKITTGSTATVTVTGSDNDNIKASSVITRMTMTQEGGGQTSSFDSDNKEDLKGEMGESLAKDLNKPADVLIDKKTGAVKSASPEKPEDKEDNPLSDLMGGGSSTTSAVGPAFFAIPAGKKAGDKWADSTSAAGLKSVMNYELQSVKDGIATVLVKTKKSGTLSKEAQGMQIDVTISSDETSTVTLNAATGIIKKSETATTAQGTLDMMGQSLPISITSTTTATTQE